MKYKEVAELVLLAQARPLMFV